MYCSLDMPSTRSSRDMLSVTAAAASALVQDSEVLIAQVAHGIMAGKRLTPQAPVDS